MRFSPRILTSIAAVALTCVVSAAAYYYKSRIPEINEVMVFCKLQFNVFNSFDKLMSYVDGARKSIDVCMPGIHSPAIQARLVTAVVKRKIQLRIIIDRNGYRDSTEFFIKELVDAGAVIKCRVKEPYNKQHKFCVIDGNILLTGTLNWGDDRTSDNWNYAYITNRRELVEPVKREFDQMWSVDMELEEALKSPPTEYETDESHQEITDENRNVTAEIYDVVPDNDTSPKNTVPIAKSLLESHPSSKPYTNCI